MSAACVSLWDETTTQILPSGEIHVLFVLHPQSVSHKKREGGLGAFAYMPCGKGCLHL